LQVIANQIDGNPHQPGIDAAFPPKSTPAFVGIPETVLSQRFGKIHIAERCKQESKYPWPVLLDKTIEILELQSRVLHTQGNEPGCSGCSHALL
jgi:hypothetical protein